MNISLSLTGGFLLSSRLLAPNWTNTIRLDEIRTIKLTFLLGRIPPFTTSPFGSSVVAREDLSDGS
jgi:hypothetical protein